MSDSNDDSIPVLHEILVPGQVRSPSSGTGAAALADAPKEPSFRTEPAFALPPSQADEPALAPQPVLAEAQTLAPEPVIAPPIAQPAILHHDDALAASASVFDRAEPAAPVEAGSIVPPDIAHESAAPAQPDLDAEVIAERLRGRFAGFLTGEGRGIIEARCRDALQEHTTWLVSQITREVALTLETEMSGWVREAVEEEVARRSGRG
jgi:hypothetical protein